jgi:zinc protease
VREGELADAKAYLTGSFPLAIETPDSIAAHLLDHLFYELPLEDLDRYREEVSAVTVADVARVAREILRPDRLSIVLVGRAEAFVHDLRGVGFGRVERIPAGELDLMATELRRR